MIYHRIIYTLDNFFITRVCFTAINVSTNGFHFSISIYPSFYASSKRKIIIFHKTCALFGRSPTTLLFSTNKKKEIGQEYKQFHLDQSSCLIYELFT